MSDASTPRGCIFCGASPLTKTHLIASKSIRQHLPQRGHTVSGSIAWIDEAGNFKHTARSFNTDPLEQWVKRACDPCNRVWMGSIEIEVAPLVISLAKGEKVSVGAGEAARLALWASIVAVLRSTQDPGRSSVRPEDVRYMREHSETPPDYIVWLLHGQPMWNFQTRHQRLFLEDQEGRMSPAHVTWFWIGHSVYVVAPSVAASWLGVLGLARSAVVILHPYGEYPITWPLRGEIARTAMIDMTNAIALPLESWWRGFEPREE